MRKNKNILKINGGEKTIKKSFKKYNSIGKEELRAAKSVIESGILSRYLGSWSKDFYGGKYVKKFERNCEKYFDVKNAITVNSWTSGLIVAIGAIGIEPGDEIIVSPWTMCATATAIVHWNAIPVFADIHPETFTLDPKSILKNITPYTKAIISVDIFGRSADVREINKIAKKNKLKVISDTAQAPGSKYKNKYSGTLTDIGGYSLNYHKHIHTGEGGILVTNNNEIAERMRLIRNHAEAVVKEKGVKNLSNMIGHNFRLGEIECAIGIEQLKKLKKLIKPRQIAANKLYQGIKDLRGINLPKKNNDYTNVYYIFPIILDIKLLKVKRDKIIEALAAEGVEGLISGYTNIHLLPMYQKKIAYGKKGFPWTISKRDISYKKGICPVAENLHDNTFMGIEMCLNDYKIKDINLIIKSFKKVWKNYFKLNN